MADETAEQTKAEENKIVKKSTAVKPSNSWLWIKDSKGFASVSLTFATVSFFVTTAAYIVSIFQSIGPVTFRQFDVGACGSYFGTIMALYWGRKWTEAKYKPPSEDPSSTQPNAGQ
jgi:hypothetical protein